MAYGGGMWTSQNKVLPGAYINFTSKNKAQAALSDRGIVCVPYEFGWGKESVMQLLTADDFISKSFELFGYPYDADELILLRELFRHATKAYLYRLGTGAQKAACTYATAVHGGTRGNDIYIKISINPDLSTIPDEGDTETEAVTYYDVSTYIGDILIDEQTVQSASELSDNSLVTFIKTVTLAATVKTPLTGGTNATITGTDHQAFLNAAESYAFNTMCCPSSDSVTKALYVNFTRRMRDEVGAKFQTVVYRSDADYEGIISVDNTVTTTGASAYSLVYWVCGAQAGCSVAGSLTNAAYDGEFAVNTSYTQAELEQGLAAGKFMLHNANGMVRVLEDINTLITYTDEKGDVFGSNQTVRVCDQIANDIAVLFTEQYLGKVPNDASGRAALWNDAIILMNELKMQRAIEDFDSDAVTVNVGNDRKSVSLTMSGITVNNAMTKLYMSVVIA